MSDHPLAGVDLALSEPTCNDAQSRPPMVGPWVRWFDPADAWHSSRQCADPYCPVCRRVNKDDRRQAQRAAAAELTRMRVEEGL